MTKTTNAESQIDKFKQAARDIGADESEEHFKERLRKIAKAAPSKDGKRDDRDE